MARPAHPTTNWLRGELSKLQPGQSFTCTPADIACDGMTMGRSRANSAAYAVFGRGGYTIASAKFAGSITITRIAEDVAASADAVGTTNAASILRRMVREMAGRYGTPSKATWALAVRITGESPSKPEAV